MPPRADEAGRGALDTAFSHAYQTLLRGADFLANGIGTRAPGISGRYRAKVIGNGLRELDRFLNLLIDEARRAADLPGAPRQHNTANKLRGWSIFDLSDSDHARLRALGRSRDCLFHCEGRVTRGDGRAGTVFSTGWRDRDRPGAPLVRVPIGGMLNLTGDDLADVCSFYRHLAIRLAALATGSDGAMRGHKPASGTAGQRAPTENLTHVASIVPDPVFLDSLRAPGGVPPAFRAHHHQPKDRERQNDRCRKHDQADEQMLAGNGGIKGNHWRHPAGA